MSAGSSRLEIRLLGPVEIVVDGRPLAVDTRKAVAMLAYLAAGGGESSRDHLADLFWPEADPERARATLRRTLSALRSALGERWVVADRNTVRLESDGLLAIDVEPFAAAAADTHDHDDRQVCSRCIGTLDAAARLYRAEFMEGFSLRDAPGFDDWMIGEAEHFRRLASGLFERLSAAHAASGRYPEAIEAGSRRLAIDPLHEQAHRRQMLLHAWSGDRAGAVAAYRECVSRLDRELGVEPLEETTELYEAILEDDLPRAPGPVRPISPAPAPPPHAVERPFVGREKALSVLVTAARAGGSLVVVDGGTGMGKTRLVEEAVSRLEGEVLAVGRAYRSEAGLAFAPLHGAITDLLETSRGRWQRLPASILAEASRLFPLLSDGAPLPAEITDPVARTRFLEAVAEVLSSLGDPLVLIVDNLQWADVATLELVAYLARRLERLGLSMILTRRPEDTAIDHPVSVLVDELSATAVVVELDPLGPDDVAELVRAAGRADLDPVTIHRQTGGVPFYVVASIESADDGSGAVPGAVQRLLEGRLAEMTEQQRQILSAAAVLGGPFDLDMVRSVSGRSDDETVTALEGLIRRAMLRDLEDGRLDFTHEQLRDVVYAGCSIVRRRLLHRRAGEMLAARPSTLHDPRAVAAAAGHHLAAGQEIEAARLSVIAGDLAVGLYARQEALGHYQTAMALGHPDRLDLLVKIGDLALLAGTYGAALNAFETVLAETPAERRALPALRIAEVYRRLRRWELAAAHFEEASALVSEPDERSRLAADWALVEYRRGGIEAAAKLSAQALTLAEETGDPAALAHAHNVAGLLGPDEDTRTSHLEAALRHATHPVSKMSVLNNLALTLARGGESAKAVDLAHQALELASELGDRHREAALRNNLADALHATGDDEAAMTELKKAVALFAEIGLEPGALEPEVWLLREW